ncbi:MAG: DMT family transporter [Rhizobiaceae bacterium]|nr:DMT family transporter [Rhizobiaceae bacterium]
MIVFGSATPVSKLVAEAMPVFVGASLRVVLGALVLAPFAWAARDAVRKLDRRDWLLVGLIALFGMFGFTVLLLLGMKLASGVAGSIVMATTPAVTATAAVLIFGEQATWRKIAAIALAVAGVVVLHATGGGPGSTEQSPPSWAQGLGSLVSAAILGSMLVFAAVCCEAVYTLVGRKVSQDSDPRLVAFLGAALSLPLFLPLAAWQWQEFDTAGVGWQGWTALGWYGAGTLALGTLLWYNGVSKTKGTIAAGFMGLMPVSALVLSYVLLGEPFRLVHLAGFAIVFAGVLLMSWEHARMAKD